MSVCITTQHGQSPVWDCVYAGESLWIHVSLSLYCVLVCERGRDRVREREKEKERERGIYTERGEIDRERKTIIKRRKEKVIGREGEGREMRIVGQLSK